MNDWAATLARLRKRACDVTFPALLVLSSTLLGAACAGDAVPAAVITPTAQAAITPVPLFGAAIIPTAQAAITSVPLFGDASTPVPSVTPTPSADSPPTRVASVPTYWPTEGWRSSTPEEQGMDSRRLAEMLGKIGKDGFIHSVLVVRNGCIVLDAYFYPHAKGIKHDVADVTKSITSALVGIAIDQGAIDGVDQRVLDFFPDVADPDPKKEAMTISEKIGQPVTFREPIVDAILPDGSRVNIVYGGDVSKRGSNFTLRKFSATPLSVLNLIDSGSLNYEMAAYLSFMLRDGMNIFVSGETASGKTTLLNALTTFVRPDAKIVTIEDTPEVQLPHPNWTREVVRGSSKGDTGGSPVTMMDLLKAALRQRPNEIIIGEIRGEEGAVAFQAMQTGLACLATFHASSVEKLIQRLTGNPINIPRTYIDSLNVVIITSSVALPNGTPVRRVISINEIISYDPASDSFSYVEMFRWNAYSDTYEFVGYQNSYLLEQVIAPKKGISPNNRRRIYGELAKRAEVLKKLHQTQYTRFYDFYTVLSKAYREGLLR